MSANEIDLILDCFGEMYPGVKPAIYLDEIQIIDGWDKFARRLADQKYRIMIAGCNAKMLSAEIAAALGARYIMREVFPFSFIEYLNHFSMPIGQNWLYDSEMRHHIYHAFEEYFCHGGFAESFSSPDRHEWLNSLYSKVLLGDIVMRHDIRNARVFKMLVRKLAESVMQPSSITRLHNIIKSCDEKLSQPTLKDYIEYIRDAYLVFSLPNLASSLSEQSSCQKYYFIDNSILNLLTFDNKTKLLENLTAVTLNRKYRNTDEYRLYYYHHNIEIDFVIPEKKLAIQVCYRMSDAQTRAREMDAIIKFLRVYPDYRAQIITYESEENIICSDCTIEAIPILKWLMQDII